MPENTRNPTAKEKDIWRRFQILYAAIRTYRDSNIHLLDLALLAQDFGRVNDFPEFNLEPAKQQIVEINLKLQRLARVITDVNNKKIGVKFHGGGDEFDVVSWEEINSDQWGAYQFGMVPFWVVIAGIGVASYAWTKAMNLFDDNGHVEVQLAQCVEFVEQKSNEDDQIRKEWDHYKWLHKFDEKSTMIEELKRAALELLKNAQKGAATGISYAIPIIIGIGLIYFVLKGRK